MASSAGIIPRPRFGQPGEEPADGQSLAAAVARSPTAVLTFPAAVATLFTEVLPWVRAVSLDFSVVRADSSPLIWELNWPWASRRTSLASAVIALMSAVTVLAVASDGVRCAKLVPVARSAATSAHSAEDGDPLPAAAGADADTVTVGDAVAAADPLEDGAGGLEDELQEATASATGTARSPAAQELTRFDGDDIFLLRIGMGTLAGTRHGLPLPRR
jgi:hypothetical protein